MGIYKNMRKDFCGNNSIINIPEKTEQCKEKRCRIRQKSIIEDLFVNRKPES